mmetsp:Transcript_44004/g.110439  ORF Transcript_44004/g.110439 Transcript_44004/m.110439 type:complete len:298 (-) Transcript_44004:1126-2019(-)
MSCVTPHVHHCVASLPSTHIYNLQKWITQSRGIPGCGLRISLEDVKHPQQVLGQHHFHRPSAFRDCGFTQLIVEVAVPALSNFAIRGSGTIAARQQPLRLHSLHRAHVGFLQDPHECLRRCAHTKPLQDFDVLGLRVVHQLAVEELHGGVHFPVALHLPVVVECCPGNVVIAGLADPLVDIGFAGDSVVVNPAQGGIAGIADDVDVLSLCPVPINICLLLLLHLLGQLVQDREILQHAHVRRHALADVLVRAGEDALLPVWDVPLCVLKLVLVAAGTCTAAGDFKPLAGPVKGRVVL